MKNSARPVRRLLADAFLGVALFAAVAIGLLGVPSLEHPRPANAAEMARVAAFTGPIQSASPVETASIKPAILVARPDMLSSSSRVPAFLLLGAVFSTLFAFNLAFFRHLRRVYATPARRQKRQT